MQHYHINPSSSNPIQILLADDNPDDRYFFHKALISLSFNVVLTTVENGDRLITYLKSNSEKLPDVLFLDHNMPYKNGAECLTEIKLNPQLKELPVILYSSNLHTDVANVLYENGAHLFIRKTLLPELKLILSHVLTLIQEKKFNRPPRAEFILDPMQI